MDLKNLLIYLLPRKVRIEESEGGSFSQTVPEFVVQSVAEALDEKAASRRGWRPMNGVGWNV
jgi:hypothetical protein